MEGKPEAIAAALMYARRWIFTAFRVDVPDRHETGFGLIFRPLSGGSPAFDRPVVAVSDTTTYVGQITTCGSKVSPRHGRTTGLETEIVVKLM